MFLTFMRSNKLITSIRRLPTYQPTYICFTRPQAVFRQANIPLVVHHLNTPMLADSSKQFHSLWLAAWFGITDKITDLLTDYTPLLTIPFYTDQCCQTGGLPAWGQGY